MSRYECVLTTWIGPMQETHTLPCTRAEFVPDWFRSHVPGYERATFISHDAYDTIVSAKRPGRYLLATLHRIEEKGAN